jgi:hypothetical protein
MPASYRTLEPETHHEILEEIPAEYDPATQSNRPLGSLDLVEYILKQPDALHQVIRERNRQAALVPKLLGISLLGFLFFGIAMSVVLAASGTWPSLTRVVTWLDNPRLPLIAFLPDPPNIVSALYLVAAYACGLIAASGICLPSLYFYGLLAGVRMTMMDVVLHTLKSKATAAVALVGILPIYATLALSTIIFEVPASLVRLVFFIGLALPFIAGLWGTRSLYLGLSNLCDTLPEHRREQRECFLRRLVLSWSAIYTAITPVMIFTLWEVLARK